MRESLKQELDKTVPADVTLSEAKKQQILRAAQERGGGRKISRVPKLLPALAGVAVIGISGVLAYPYLMEDGADVPGETRTGEENELPAEGNNEDPEVLVPVDEEQDIEEELEKDTEQTEDAADEHVEDTEESSNQTDESIEDENVEVESPPLTKQDGLIQLFDHEFFETGIELGDAVAEIESDYPNWSEKGEVEGGLLIDYGSFVVIHGYFETTINHIILKDFNQLTVSQIEEVISQEIEIEAYFNNILNREVISGEFVLENIRYVVTAGSESEDAQVLEVTISEYFGD